MRHKERRPYCISLLITFTTNRVRHSMPNGGEYLCKSCGSVNQSKFRAEMGIHCPGLKNIRKPVVWVFPELVVCLDCGIVEFAMPEAELRLLARGDAAGSG